MGIDHKSLRFLLTSWRSGVSFRETIMIGRQGLYVSDVRLADILREFGLPGTIEVARKLLSDGDGYMEPLLRLLGAERVDSIDASPFEGARYVHDLNVPLDGSLEGKYTAVIDGGSLEHVFNFPVAIENCMRLVSEGGHLITIAPTNNQMGHGLYQFSPDLYFRILSPCNDFKMELCVAVEESLSTKWFEVADPAAVGGRVGSRNSIPMFLFVRAKRTGPVRRLRVTPQQSDYSVLWTTGNPGNRPVFRDNRTERLKLALSPVIDFARRAQAVWHNTRPFHNRRGFSRYDP